LRIPILNILIIVPIAVSGGRRITLISVPALQSRRSAATSSRHPHIIRFLIIVFIVIFFVTIAVKPIVDLIGSSRIGDAFLATAEPILLSAQVTKILGKPTQIKTIIFTSNSHRLFPDVLHGCIFRRIVRWRFDIRDFILEYEIIIPLAKNKKKKLSN
jgi:hypothetical protein